MKDSLAIMDLCQTQLPEHTDGYIPDLVHDFIWDNWERLKEILE